MQADQDGLASDEMSMGGMLRAVEDTAPVESVDVIARNLADHIHAASVAFLFADLAGHELVHFTASSAAGPDRDAERIPRPGSVYDEVLRTQQLHQEPAGEGSAQRVIVPVTNRGDSIGVLELVVPHTDEAVLRYIRDAAHALAYIIVTDGRFTDLYKWAGVPGLPAWPLRSSTSCCPQRPAVRRPSSPSPRRSCPPTVSPGIPTTSRWTATPCSCPLPTWKVTMSRSALLASLLMGALRGARRAGHCLPKQARQANQALLDYSGGAIATGNWCASA